MAFEIRRAAPRFAGGPDTAGNPGTSANRFKQAAFGLEADTLELTAQSGTPKQGFSILNAGKEFIKGALRPIANVLQHPFISAGIIAGAIAIAAVAPISIPIAIAGGLAFGGFQFGRGLKNAIQEIRKGNHEAAEKAFSDIGEGTFTIATSAMGVRAGAAIAAKAKAATDALKLEAVAQVKSGSWLNALKETFSVFTSKAGRQAIKVQMRPKTMVSNFQEKGRTVLNGFNTPVEAAMPNSAGSTAAASRIKLGDLYLQDGNLVVAPKPGQLSHAAFQLAKGKARGVADKLSQAVKGLTQRQGGLPVQTGTVPTVTSPSKNLGEKIAGAAAGVPPSWSTEPHLPHGQGNRPVCLDA